MNAREQAEFFGDPAPLPEELVRFDELPDAAQVDQHVTRAVLGCSRASLYRHVKAGRLPPPSKIIPGRATWNVGELRAIKAKLSAPLNRAGAQQ